MNQKENEEIKKQNLELKKENEQLKQKIKELTNIYLSTLTQARLIIHQTMELLPDSQSFNQNQEPKTYSKIGENLSQKSKSKKIKNQKRKIKRIEEDKHKKKNFKN
ncbi:b-zip transcription factor (eurofung)-related [Anaeramoeba ignava]|uniref:B-zip transcription factor (Eurofung)-related n=1 Tax=Anaeramoeba ignava TaxID=1746090 RepID=A0A9Q0RG15_ANAIG|nr:b-zip transcription factor (eurofung)-related [Anaeramoeba ignava]